MQFRINLTLWRMSSEVDRVCSKLWGDSKYTRNFSRDIRRKSCMGDNIKLDFELLCDVAFRVLTCRLGCGMAAGGLIFVIKPRVR